MREEALLSEGSTRAEGPSQPCPAATGERQRLAGGLALYPLYYAVLPVLISFNVRAANSVPLYNLLLPFAVCLLLGLSVLVVSRILLRGRQESALLAFSIINAFYAITYLLIAFEFALTVFHIGLAAHLAQYALLALWLGLLLTGVAAVLKPVLVLPVVPTLASSGRFLLVLQILVLLYHEGSYQLLVRPAVQARQAQIRQQACCRLNSTPAITGSPDIYYIILDEMAGASVLSRVFGYDNSSFRSQLAKRGFVVASSSRSNFPLTRLSISSSLNLSNLEFLPDLAGRGSEDYSVTNDLLQNSVVARILSERGYSYVHIGSEMPPTDYSPFAKVSFHPDLDEFAIRFIESTSLSFLPDLSQRLADSRRRTRLASLRALSESGAASPRFVFCHMLSPHEPFIFNHDGSGRTAMMPLRRDGLWDEAARRAYVEQVRFMEARILICIDDILRQSKERPIIILQGDHGTYAEDELARENPREALFQERYDILNAYLVPERIKPSIYSSISPVNSFRLIFSQFGYDLPLLPDRCFYSTYGRPFKIRDVTERVLRRD
ncbi:MAG: hypothetical protein HY986_24895 [Candidatus Melainabacteria bacterium]|nr:hypothetical protein [Candidatus Melainabacteria bacterium]